MNKKILLLGHTGKMGTALLSVFSGEYSVEGRNSSDFDAFDNKQVRSLIETSKPDIVINTVAFMGIDPCEKEPERAYQLNALYPKLLAELSKEYNFLLVHFSTDAVFNDEKEDFYTENDTPCPLNKYGATKCEGDSYIQKFAECYYIMRVSVLFGETPKETQFVEKMLKHIEKGEKTLRISGDIISSPTYSRDVAKEVKEIIEGDYAYGVYHIANEGKASLYELMKEIIDCLKLDVSVEKASYHDFPFVGKKNTCTPIISRKIKALRSWREAVADYCNNIKSSLKEKGILT